MPSLMWSGLSSHIFKLYCVEYITSRGPGLEIENIISTRILLARMLSHSPQKTAGEGGKWAFLCAQEEKGLWPTYNTVSVTSSKVECFSGVQH